MHFDYPFEDLLLALAVPCEFELVFCLARAQRFHSQDVFHVIEATLRRLRLQDQIAYSIQTDRQIQILIVFGMPDESEIGQEEIPLETRIAFHILHHTRNGEILLIVFDVLVEVDIKFDEFELPYVLELVLVVKHLR